MLRIDLIIKVLAVVMLLHGVSFAQALDGWMREGELWTQSSEAFSENNQNLGFSFVDGGMVAQSNHEELSMLGLCVWEARVYFGRSGVERWELSLYNKGDAGDLGQEEFKELIGKILESVSEVAGSRGITGKSSSDRANYHVNRRQWVADPVGVQLEWAFVNAHRSGGRQVPFRAEFVKLLLVPHRGGSMGVRTTATPEWAGQASARSIRGNVKSSDTGDVWVDGVPMVDQGQKGYCAATTSERILRYYGRQVDQHAIAQLADTAAEGGTSLEGMASALQSVSRRYQLDHKELIRSDAGRRFDKSNFYTMLEQYNRLAKQRKKAPVDMMEYATMSGNTRMIDSMRIYEALDAEILRESRARQRQQLEAFRRNIIQYSSQGVPLFWACIVGKYAEQPDIGQQGAFGHIRLIIGFNQRSQEVLYSDTWGAGHELKRISLDDAWAMTFGLTVVKPRDVR